MDAQPLVIKRPPCFNGHPPLGVNATEPTHTGGTDDEPKFQRAPTLGGECYVYVLATKAFNEVSTGTHPWGWMLLGGCSFLGQPPKCFNGHPPLGVDATGAVLLLPQAYPHVSTGTHPWGWMLPTGTAVVAISGARVSTGTHPWGWMLQRHADLFRKRFNRFQRAPTLGGGCYWYARGDAPRGSGVSTGTHPWGWMLLCCYCRDGLTVQYVSTGTHPWGWMLPSRSVHPSVDPRRSFNGHPPLGVDATKRTHQRHGRYSTGFNGHPPLGVDATAARRFVPQTLQSVSTGTHPWGWMLLVRARRRASRQRRFNGHPPLGVDATLLLLP